MTDAVVKDVVTIISDKVQGFAKAKRVVAIYYLEQALEEGHPHWYLVGKFHDLDSDPKGHIHTQIFITDVAFNFDKDSHYPLQPGYVSSEEALYAVIPEVEYWRNYVALLMTCGDDDAIPLRVRHDSEKLYSRALFAKNFKSEAIWLFNDCSLHQRPYDENLEYSGYALMDTNRKQ